MKFLTHGGKFDISMLQKWGVSISYDRIVEDTKILAYVYDSSLESLKLKFLANHFLNIDYPTYKEMVGTGKNKQTLDLQPVERVAAYCGLDTFSTFKLRHYLLNCLSHKQKKYYYELELPVYRLLSQLEDKGVFIDSELLQKTDKEFKQEMDYWEDKLKSYAPTVNPRSPKQLIPLLNQYKIPVKSTNNTVLEPYKDRIIVSELLKYRKYKKLKSTYTEAFLNNPTLPWVHANFLQKTLTGRLASSKPNLQNIPVSTLEGKKIRGFFIAPLEHRLLVLDYSQIEYRLFAHFTQDPILLEAYNIGEDVHEKTGKLVQADRKLGKTLNFAAIYGAQPKRIAQTAGIKVSVAEQLLEQYWSRLPKAAAWITAQKWLARKNGAIETLFGRKIKLRGIDSSNVYERLHAERVGVNAIIQGSAAEIIKQAMLNLQKINYIPICQVHDELLFYIHESDLDKALSKIKQIMETAVSLTVPLIVTGGYVNTWAEAK